MTTTYYIGFFFMLLLSLAFLAFGYNIIKQDEKDEKEKSKNESH